MGRLWLRRLQQLFGRQLQVEQRLLRPLLAASTPAAKRSKTSTSGFMADSSDEASDEGDNPEQEDTDELAPERRCQDGRRYNVHEDEPPVARGDEVI